MEIGIGNWYWKLVTSCRGVVQGSSKIIVVWWHCAFLNFNDINQLIDYEQKSKLRIGNEPGNEYVYLVCR